MRRLGVDAGTKRIGLAFAEDESLALPVGIVAPEEAVRAVRTLVAERGVEEIVVGLPLTMDGRETGSARLARRLATALERATALPVVMWDERMTTLAAERSLRALGVRGREMRGVVDEAAATILLQSHLDALRARAAREDDTWEPDEDAQDESDPSRPGDPAPHDAPDRRLPPRGRAGEGPRRRGPARRPR